MTQTKTANLANAILALVLAVMAALVAFGVHVTVEQQAAVMGLISALLMLAATVIATRGMDRSRIVEHLTPSGRIPAGEANEIATGTPIRDIGDNPALTGALVPDEMVESAMVPDVVDPPKHAA